MKRAIVAAALAVALDVGRVTKLLRAQTIGQQRVGCLEQRRRSFAGPTDMELSTAAAGGQDTREDRTFLLNVPGAALNHAMSYRVAKSVIALQSSSYCFDRYRSFATQTDRP